jgi:TonB family protein
MIGRSLRIAIGISLGMHIFAMSAVTIVTPENIGRIKGYPRVDFLGPILEKTAFDIMLESATPVVKTSYSWEPLPFESGYLKASSPGRITMAHGFPQHLESRMDNTIFPTLTGYKGVPDFFLDLKEETLRQEDLSAGERKIIYTPEPPFFVKGLYGGKETILVRVKALVSPEGNVKSTEPVTTSGYPQLDILATKFVRSWIFEPKKEGGDEWVVLEVILNTGE